MTAHDDLRAAWAHVVRDHDMPPNKNQRGYDYRMGWWDAVTYIDRILGRGIRACEDCPVPTAPSGGEVTANELAEVIASGIGADGLEPCEPDPCDRRAAAAILARYHVTPRADQ